MELEIALLEGFQGTREGRNTGPTVGLLVPAPFEQNPQRGNGGGERGRRSNGWGNASSNVSKDVEFCTVASTRRVWSFEIEEL